jgi:predicted acyl esterase
MRTGRLALIVTLSLSVASALLSAQPQSTLTPAEIQRRHDLERELNEIAIVERKVMMPMRDGVRLATDIYRPKNAPGPVPIVFVKTPYNFNFWDVRNGVPADMSTMIAAIRRGPSSPRGTTTSSARPSPTATKRSSG